MQPSLTQVCNTKNLTTEFVPISGCTTSATGEGRTARTKDNPSPWLHSPCYSDVRTVLLLFSHPPFALYHGASSLSRALPCAVQHHSGIASGEQTDMYLYVTSNNLYCEAGVSAFAIPCIWDYASNRPLLSNFNLCASSLANATLDKLLAITVHEMLHTLGFSSSMFGFFVDAASGAELGISAVAGFIPALSASSSPEALSLRSNYSLIVSPNVLQQVCASIRRGFLCNLPRMRGTVTSAYLT